LSTFARKKGSRDRKKRKKRSLRDNLFGTTTTGRVARGAGALLATGAALKYGKPKVLAKAASVKRQAEKVVNSTQQVGNAAQDIGQAAQKIGNAVEKVGNMVDDIRNIPANVKQKFQSMLAPSRKAIKQLSPSPVVPDPPNSSPVYNGYDSLEDYVKNRKRRRFNNGNSIAKFARKKGSKDKKKRKRSLTDNLFGTTATGRAVRVAALGASVGRGRAQAKLIKIGKDLDATDIPAIREAIKSDPDRAVKVARKIAAPGKTIGKYALGGAAIGAGIYGGELLARRAWKRFKNRNK
jgi:hypothetical protein